MQGPTNNTPTGVYDGMLPMSTKFKPSLSWTELRRLFYLEKPDQAYKAKMLDSWSVGEPSTIPAEDFKLFYCFCIMFMALIHRSHWHLIEWRKRGSFDAMDHKSFCRWLCEIDLLTDALKAELPETLATRSYGAVSVSTEIARR